MENTVPPEHRTPGTLCPRNTVPPEHCAPGPLRLPKSGMCTCDLRGVVRRVSGEHRRGGLARLLPARTALF